MAKHVFGGDWTSEKLERVRKYLCAYTNIFKKNPRAAYFTTVYVDAFAGTGERVESAGRCPKAAAVLDEEDLADADALQKGSARIALEVDPPFDRFLFIERSAKRVKELEKLRSEFPDRAAVIQIEQGDANDVLQQWCRDSDWQRHRSVVFLDPYGMQVDWATIEAIAATAAIDLWILFPLGMAVNRLLTKNEPPPPLWADALTRFFGNEEWKQEFYPKRKELTLFGEEETERKEANFERIGQFFLKRLKTVFAQVATNPLIMNNSKGVPIFLLCFAAGNPKGAPTAVKIAKDILK
ncbi:MAG: three-Cys-motif partner protein TcmP [Gemmataceae bacterium]